MSNQEKSPCAADAAGTGIDSTKQNDTTVPTTEQPILTAALEYFDRGWSIVPVRFQDKRAIGRWKQYQEERAGEDELREWFPVGKDANLAVVVGEVSGRLACMDFDDMKVYERWAEANPKLAETLPTVETNRGRHVYFTLPADSPLRRNSETNGVEIFVRRHIITLPPSVHPSGKHYRWVIPLPDGDIPQFDPVEAGLVKAEEPCVAIADTLPATEANTIPVGRRKKTLMKLAGAMRRYGADEETIRQALHQHNERLCRPPLEEYEVEDVVKSAMKYRPAATGEGRGGRDCELVTVKLADVEPEDIEWLWLSRIPVGKLSIIAGDPGLGKSFLTLDMAARVSSGAAWPDLPDHPNEPGNVLLLSAEDGLADTISPRLDAAGAKMRRITAIEGVKESGQPTLGVFSLEKSLDALRRELHRGQYRLLVIDPITAYMGTIDSHRNTDVRRVLAPLANLAEDHRVAVVVVSHLNKMEAQRAIHRTTGSLGFVAAARAAWLVTEDPKDRSRRLLLPLKMNVAENPDGLAFQLEDGRVRWASGRVEMSADDALAALAGDAKSPSVVQEAAEWLRELLAKGPTPAQEVFQKANEAGHSEAAVNRAKKVAGVVVGKDGFQGQSIWRLPKVREKAAKMLTTIL